MDSRDCTKQVSKVNYHVIIEEDKKVHRHIDQLVARVPDLGIAQEAVEVGISGIENNQDREGTTRTRRERKPPSWTKDFKMSTN